MKKLTLWEKYKGNELEIRFEYDGKLLKADPILRLMEAQLSCLKDKVDGKKSGWLFKLFKQYELEKRT